ncbi:MAG: GNAT family N-acetyltransferase [Gordonia sp. (in: high G+C Gram-positive bacteria)]|uniref:GNAT family N-acetyltransferase n=1 Tax=Gordonia sp. (in: high G+C Gram-positive bacteria) TaxID=84139 RepID=UPI003BB7102F
MSSEHNPLVLRRATEADWPAINTLDTRSFGLPAPLPDGELAEFRAKVDDAIVVCDAGSDESPVVAVSLWHTLPLTVPGGTPVPSAGLSWVSVAATHRRRGLLRAMMTEQFAAWHAADLPLAILTASEGGIYERFGFGPACFAQQVTVDRATARWRTTAPADSRVRYATPAQVADRVPALHRRWAHTVPGAVGRPDSWWPTIFADRDYRRSTQTSGLSYLLHDDGYAAYRIDARTATALVAEVCAVTDQAHADLWRVLTGLDLVHAVSATLALDDPLPHRLRDARAVQVTGRRDELWLTILDVAAALAVRDYAADGHLALEVTDDWGDRAGWYLLEVTDGRGRVRRASAPEGAGLPHLTLSVSVLSSLYTGGTTAREFAAAGRLTADLTDTVDVLDALLGTRRAPFAGTYF